MNIDDFLVDRVSLLKTNGQVSENLKAQVSQKQILMKGDIAIDVGDIIVRSLENGISERYCVKNPVYQASVLGFPAHYKLQVEKEGVASATPSQMNVTHNTYHLHGDNARVNNQSTDNSFNVVTNDIGSYIEQLRSEIQKVVTEPHELEEALGVVDVIEGQLESPKPNKTIVTSMISALPALGNIASIGSLIVGAMGL
ncbi:hypothetical protein ACSWYU_005193 [Vibrio harveyi]